MIGAGDDAAAVSIAAGATAVVTQDALVENVDFVRGWTTPAAVGSKGLAISLSDLAAMGAAPLCCTATVCAPASTCVDDLMAIQAGLLLRGNKAGCALVGGDLSAIDGPLVIDVCAVGSARPDRLLRRDAGRAGDVLVVTGRLGQAAAGLEVLRGRGQAASELRRQRWVALQNRGRARLREGAALALAGVRCAGDLSDGLLVDAARTAAASGCAAELWVESVPVDAELREAFPEDWVALALGGGEDFELLAAMPDDLLAQTRAAWRHELAPLTVVGRFVEGDGVRVVEREGSDVEVAPPAVRSRHFGSGV